MNFVLSLILCSNVAGQCLPPYRYPDLFVDGYSCMIAGNTESIKNIENDFIQKNLHLTQDIQF